MQLLALSGSLRAGSSNTILLEAAARLAPPGLSVTLWDGLASLPHFNPDSDSGESSELPIPVVEWRRAVGKADGLLLSTPEYASGLPGSFKNALDWLVGSVEFPGKTVAILSPTARSVNARAQLRLVLTTMSARVAERPSWIIPLPGRNTTLPEILERPALSSSIREMMREVADEIQRNTREADGLTVPPRDVA